MTEDKLHESAISPHERLVKRNPDYDMGFVTAANVIVDQVTESVAFTDALHDIRLDLPRAPEHVQIFLANAAMVYPVRIGFNSDDPETDDEKLFTEESIISKYYGVTEHSLVESTGYADVDSIRSAFGDECPQDPTEFDAFIERIITHDIAHYLRQLALNRGVTYQSMVAAVIGGDDVDFDVLKRVDNVEQSGTFVSLAGFILTQTFTDRRLESVKNTKLREGLDNFWTGNAMGHTWDQEVDWTVQQVKDGKHVVLGGMNGIGKTLYYGYGNVSNLDNENVKAIFLHEPDDWSSYEPGVIAGKYDALIIDEAMELAFTADGQTKLSRILEVADATDTKLVFILASAMRSMREEAAAYIAAQSTRETAQSDVGSKYLAVDEVAKLLSSIDCDQDLVQTVTSSPYLLIPRIFNCAVAGYIQNTAAKGNRITTVGFQEHIQAWIDTGKGSDNHPVFTTLEYSDLRPYEIDSGSTEDVRAFYEKFNRRMPEAGDKLSRVPPLSMGEPGLDFLNKS